MKKSNWDMTARRRKERRKRRKTLKIRERLLIWIYPIPHDFFFPVVALFMVKGSLQISQP